MAIDPVTGVFSGVDPVDLNYGILSQTFPTIPGRAYQVDYRFGVPGLPFGSPFGVFATVFGDQVFEPRDVFERCDAKPGSCVPGPTAYTVPVPTGPWTSQPVM